MHKMYHHHPIPLKPRTNLGLDRHGPMSCLTTTTPSPPRNVQYWLWTYLLPIFTAYFYYLLHHFFRLARQKWAWSSKMASGLTLTYFYHLFLLYFTLTTLNLHVKIRAWSLKIALDLTLTHLYHLFLLSSTLRPLIFMSKWEYEA